MRDTDANRKKLEPLAKIMTEEMKLGLFDYNQRFPGERFEEQSDETIGGYYERWIKTKGHSRKSARRDYIQHFSGYLLSEFGSTSLATIRVSSLSTFRDKLLGQGLSVKTCRNILDGSLRAMLRDAQKLDGLGPGVEPFKELRWKREIKPPPETLTERQRDKVLRYFRNHRGSKYSYRWRHYYPFLHALFFTGCRPSELVALKKTNVDLSRRRFEIVESRHLKAEDAPKTVKARRVVQLLPETARLLRREMRRRGEYLFTKPEGAPIDADNFGHDFWATALRRLGIPHRKFYSTKHTYASIAVSRGVNLKRLSEQLGETVETIERRYAKWMPVGRGDPLMKVTGRRQTV